MQEYYDRRAPEYDEWYRGAPYTGEQRRSFLDEIVVLERLVAALPPARTLDVACGTGFLTRRLQGEVTGLDQSAAMLAIARRQAPTAAYMLGNALALPFGSQSFGRVFTGHFYGHLESDERTAFLAQARRIAPELVVVDAARRPDREPEEWQQRTLGYGSVWPVFKRFFRPEQLAEELGGGEILLAGRWFVMVRSRA